MRALIARQGWLPLAILAAVAVCYANSLGNSFHYDDSHAIVENRAIRSLANIPAFFVDPGHFSRESSMAMYRPALLTSYALNYALGGYGVRGFRLVNMLIHGLAALAVARLVGRLTGLAAVGWWCGLLFAVHPVQSQTINYISSRSEALSALGVLAALYWSQVRCRPALALLCYGLALLTKSTALAFLPLWILCQGLNGFEPRNWRTLAPYAGISALYVGVISVNGFLGGALAQEVRPLATQVYTQLKALVYYTKLVAMPVDLSIEHPLTASQSLSQAAVLCSLAVVLSLLWLSWRGWRHRNLAGAGGLWVYAGLAVTFLVPLNVIINEHRLYLPLIGVLLVAAGGIQGHNRLVGIVLVLVLGGLTWQRNQTWRDPLALWSAAAKRAPDAFRVQSNLGLALYEAGQLEQAVTILQRALAINGTYGKAWNNLGLAYEGLGQEHKAQKAYEKSVALQGDLAGPHANLGRLAYRGGRVQQAEIHLRRALDRDAEYAPALAVLGQVHQQRGEGAKALEVYRAAVNSEPACVEGWNNLGALLAHMGQVEPGLAALKRAVTLAPEHSEAQINLAILAGELAGRSPEVVYRQLVERYPGREELWLALGREYSRGGQWPAAIAALERGLEAAPASERLHLALGAAYRGLGRLDLAISTYETLRRQAPQYAPLYDNLAAAYAAAGRLEAAVAAAQNSVALDPQNRRGRRNLERLLQAKKGG